MSYQENKPHTGFQPIPDLENRKEDKKDPNQSNGYDFLSSFTWALILIWAGLVFLGSNLGLLDKIQIQQSLPEGLEFLGLSTWSVIFVGAGLIVFLEAIIRTFTPAHHASKGGNFFLAAIFLGIGLGGIFGWNVVWPFILIALGLSALASALIRNRS